MKNIFTKFFAKVAMVACLATVFAGSAFAESVTWPGTTALPGTLTAIDSSPISIMTSSTNTYSNPIRVYANTTITIKAASGYVIQSVTYEASSTGNYVTYAQNATVSPNVTPSVSGKNVTWTLDDATEFTFKPSSQTRTNGITVVYASTGSGSNPSISADNVDIAYDATGGSIAYTINNGVDGGSVSAALTTGDWVTLGSGTTSSIPFTCSANDTKAARTATVTLTYTYNTSETVTKAITITQAANPNIVDNISDITAAGTYAVQGTIVAKSQRGFIVGDGTGYVYYYNQDYTQSDYAIGDKVKLAGSVVAYGGVFEFNNSTTVTSVSASNYVAEDPTVLTGSQMDSRVASTTPAQLSTYVQYQGVLSVSGTYYNITSIEGASTAKGSISFPISTDFTSLNGKQVIVKGYYVGVSTSQYYNTMIGSIEEVVSSTPTITVTPTSLSGFKYEEGNGPSTTKTFTVSGSSLTENISLSVSGSNFEISLTSDSGYATSLSLPQSAGEVATTTVYARLKAGLDAGDCSGSITVSSTGANDQTVSLSGEVTVPVVPYATLPFSFDGGRDDIATTSGLTHEGLGSDYGSAQKLKFDTTGDWVILQINERPGTLTFDIKGNGFSGGTFKVQTSVDGASYSDLETYDAFGSSGNSTLSESFDNIGEDVRYIKWVYTTKSSGNVALGNIALTKYVAPSNHPVKLNAGDHTELFVFAGDQSSAISDGDEVTSGTTVWVSVDVEAGYVFSSLSVTDQDNNTVALTEITAKSYYSFTMPASNVTITSSATAAPIVTSEQYALFTGTLMEGDYIISYQGRAMNTTVSGDRLQYSDVIPANNIITTDDASIVWHIAKSGSYWTIYNAAANAYAAGTGVKNKAQMLDDGTDDKALWTVSGTDEYEFVNKANAAASVNANLRCNGSYGFACYSDQTGGALTLYKLVEAAPDATNIKATWGGDGYWASFYNSSASYELPDGAQAYTMNASHQLYRLGDGKVIPQGVAVIIIADNAYITLTKSNATGSVSVSGGANILQGSDSPVAQNGKQYVLGIKGGVMGFYLFNGGNIPAGKAYYIYE